MMSLGNVSILAVGDLYRQRGDCICGTVMQRIFTCICMCRRGYLYRGVEEIEGEKWRDECVNTMSMHDVCFHYIEPICWIYWCRWWLLLSYWNYVSYMYDVSSIFSNIQHYDGVIILKFCIWKHWFSWFTSIYNPFSFICRYRWECRKHQLNGLVKLIRRRRIMIMPCPCHKHRYMTAIGA